MIREGYPLQWPEWIPRTAKQKRSQFKTTLAQSRDAVYKQVKMLGGKNCVITTNIPVRLDGQLYATGQPVGGEKAVAVYFTWLDAEYVIACDNYDRIEDNMRGAEYIIEAIRKIEAWGNKQTVQQAFKGFMSELPQQAGASSQQLWWEILQVDPNAPITDIENKYKAMAKIYHPDKPTGNEGMFKLIGEAIAAARLYQKI